VVNIQAAPSPGLDRRMAESDDDWLGPIDKKYPFDDQKKQSSFRPNGRK